MWHMVEKYLFLTVSWNTDLKFLKLVIIKTVKSKMIKVTWTGIKTK